MQYVVLVEEYERNFKLTMTGSLKGRIFSKPLDNCEQVAVS